MTSHVVLNDDDAVALVGKGVEDAQQFIHVGKVQAGGRLVEDVEGAARAAAAEFFGQLDALGLAAGQSGGGLAELDVAEAHVVQGLKHAAHGGDVRKEVERFLDFHVQNVGD